MAVVVGVAVQYYDAFGRAPQHEVFIIVAGAFAGLADKAIAAFVNPVRNLIFLGHIIITLFRSLFRISNGAKALNVIDSPRRP